jgi:hypothetical protein
MGEVRNDASKGTRAGGVGTGRGWNRPEQRGSNLNWLSGNVLVKLTELVSTGSPEAGSELGGSVWVTGAVRAGMFAPKAAEMWYCHAQMQSWRDEDAVMAG